MCTPTDYFGTGKKLTPKQIEDFEKRRKKSKKQQKDLEKHLKEKEKMKGPTKPPHDGSEEKLMSAGGVVGRPTGQGFGKSRRRK